MVVRTQGPLKLGLRGRRTHRELVHVELSEQYAAAFAFCDVTGNFAALHRKGTNTDHDAAASRGGNITLYLGTFIHDGSFCAAIVCQDNAAAAVTAVIVVDFAVEIQILIL